MPKKIEGQAEMGSISCSGGGTFTGAFSGSPRISGTFEANGGFIANENQGNVDFRVESDDDDSMIFVDADQNCVGFGVSSPSDYDDSYNRHIVVGDDANTGRNGAVITGYTSTDNGLFARLNFCNTRASSHTNRRGAMIDGYSGSDAASGGAEAHSMRFSTTNASGTTTQCLELSENGDIIVPLLGASLDVQTGSNNELTTSSDARMKDDRGELSTGLASIMGLKPRYYTWKKTPDAPKELGFFAQEVHPFIPEGGRRVDVLDGEGNKVDDQWGINTRAIVATLVKATQEQQEYIEGLEKRVAKLESLVERLAK
jgi:hypothetical protein